MKRSPIVVRLKLCANGQRDTKKAKSSGGFNAMARVARQKTYEVVFSGRAKPVDAGRTATVTGVPLLGSVGRELVKRQTR